jgi:hypothetical protein
MKMAISFIIKSAMVLFILIAEVFVHYGSDIMKNWDAVKCQLNKQSDIYTTLNMKI